MSDNFTTNTLNPKSHHRCRRHTKLFMLLGVLILLTAIFTIAAFSEYVSIQLEGLDISYSGGKWIGDGRILTGISAGAAAYGNEPAASTTSVLTMTNSKDTSAVLAFHYAKPAIANGGRVKIDGVNVTAAGNFCKELAPGESITIEILSGSPGPSYSTLELDTIQFVELKNVTITFLPAAEGGTYTVNGAAVSSDIQLERVSSDAYVLSAAPAEGYKLMGWYGSVDGFISSDVSLNIMLDHAQTVTAIFTQEDNPVFDVAGNWFDDLNDAISYAQTQNEAVIRLKDSGTLPAGNYSIPAGKTLLVPFDSVYTLNTDRAERVDAAAPSNISLFRKLTLGDDVMLNVSGALVVNAKVNSINTGYTGNTTGKYGQMELNEGSQVNIKSGGSLYCWGYITGSGEIIAESGASVTEALVVCDLRGGSATVSMINNSNKVFPFSQYYIQNIEAPLTIMYGATEIAAGNVTIQGVSLPLSVKFIGTSGAMFTLAEGGIFRKVYDPKTDRMTFDVYGNSELNSVTMPLDDKGLIKLVSGNYAMPIMENITINIHTGTVTINQNLCLIPGFEMTIDEDAIVNLSSKKRIFIYDRDEWIGGNYINGNVDFKPSFYSPTRAASDVFTADKMVDVVVDLNGTINATGFVFTTVSGARVISSAGTGKIVFKTKPADAKVTATYQANQNGTAITYVEIPVTSVKLMNEDGTYTLTDDAAKNSSFVYCTACGNWHLSSQAHNHSRVTFVNYDGTTLQTVVVNNGTTPEYTGDLPVKPADAQYTYSFSGWDPALAPVSGNITYTAVFTAIERTFTVTYKNYDGTTVGTEQVQYGQMPLGPSETPLKAADSKFEYEFASWYPKLSEVTQDAVYTAEFSAVVPGGATVDEELDFAARSLTLYESISVNYKLDPATLASAGYSDAYVVVTLNNSGSKVVASAELDKNGRLIYQFKRLSPEYVNTTLYAVIYATKDGQLYRSPVREYSVATYCYNTLNKYATNASYAVLRTLLVDLLHYGACSQQYVGYRTGDLADAALTEAQLAQGTNTVPEMTNLESYTVNTDTPLATWSGRGLRLEDGVNFRLTFHLDTGDRPATSADLNGLCVRVTNAAGNKSWTIRSSAFNLKSGTTNDFIFYFKNFNFSMLSDPFYFTVCNAANEPISDTLCYSVETYVEKQYNKAGNPALLKNLVLAILKVGNSARAYSALLGN